MTETLRIHRARILAMAAHHGQLDKAGKPYIGHPSRVAARVRDFLSASARPDIYEDAIAVAWLHDVVEDTDVTLSDIAARFEPNIVAAVEALTHRPREPRSNYYRRVRANEIARIVKLADIADNSDPERLALLDTATRERLVSKYDAAVIALTEER